MRRGILAWDGSALLSTELASQNLSAQARVVFCNAKFYISCLSPRPLWSQFIDTDAQGGWCWPVVSNVRVIILTSGSSLPWSQQPPDGNTCQQISFPHTDTLKHNHGLHPSFSWGPGLPLASDWESGGRRVEIPSNVTFDFNCIKGKAFIFSWVTWWEF